MRQLKFRAWDEKYGYEFWDSLTCPSYSMPEVFCQNRILEQFTGLSDKNGKEIFEGDIVLIPFGYGGDIKYQQALGVVKYEAPEFCILTENHSDYAFSDLEIIGNIHEMADLIK